MENCIFCKIARHEIPAEILFENDMFIAFYDIHPKANTHVLLIPKKHLGSAIDLNQDNEAIATRLIQTANQIAKQLNLKNGYRLVLNIGPDSGSEVNHLHMHILGGNELGDLA